MARWLALIDIIDTEHNIRILNSLTHSDVICADD